MRITFLGTGTSQGIPVIACECAVCKSLDFRDKRLRVSILVEENDKTFIIDTGPDFRYQMLRAGVKKLDAVIFTHEHKDHIAGLDDVRAFNYFQQKPMDVYAHHRVINSLRREFHYAFEESKYPGVPAINLHQISKDPFVIDGVEFIPIEVMHHLLSIFGYRIKNFTYITDANYIVESEIEKIKGSDVLVINALQKGWHISHFTLEEAIEFAVKAGAKQTYITHIGHKMGKHEDVIEELSAGISLAYDGLVLEL